MSELTILNTYRLKGTAADFTAAITALAARVQAEGHRGVMSYQFFVNVAAGQGRAVVDYEGPEAWIGHHDISMGWPEMKALHAVAELVHVIFLGPMTDEIRLWLVRSGLKAEVETGYVAAAGFRRV